jgi:hypothetical protein
MWKRILGILFIIIASLSTVITVLFLPSSILSFIKHAIESESAYDYGYLSGKLIGLFFQIAIIVVLWIFGLRWIKNPKR